MPSPFPGMDPFLEGQAWETFHHGLIAVLLESLTLRVRPRYVVRVEERVYVERDPEHPREIIRPDVSVMEQEGERVVARGGGPSTMSAPVLLTVPMPERVREAFLSIRHRDTREVVTIIEVLSPANKRPGGDGRHEYLRRRATVLQSPTHLVELDLLRGGQRLPTVEPLPPADYYALICRGDRRPQVEVYPWTLRQPLPLLPVPLRGEDPDVVLDLQALFQAVHERAGCDYSLDYQLPVEPPLEEPETDWVRALVAAT